PRGAKIKALLVSKLENVFFPCVNSVTASTFSNFLCVNLH
uniref:Uncharacterized protein n=1 Tax=Aegilops tauschii subsp. strangulata TaxID=200361 RepID=A0A453CRX5_AEGTS